MSGSGKVVAAFGLIVLGLIFLDYFNLITLSTVSSQVFNSLIFNNIYFLVPVVFLIMIYILNYKFLRSRLYDEEIMVKKSLKKDSLSNIKYLKTLGITGEMIALELKLYWRNKRTRTIIYMLPLFVLYGFFFYPQEMYREGFGFLIFVGVFMTGGMMLNYANYAFAYESNYFDFILSNTVDFDRYFRIKFINSVMIIPLSRITIRSQTSTT